MAVSFIDGGNRKYLEKNLIVTKWQTFCILCADIRYK
jgi:hypothetical protein